MSHSGSERRDEPASDQTPHGVLDEFADIGVQLNLRMLDDDTVFVEGDRESLRFLSKLIWSMTQDEDCGFSMGPNRQGSAWFTQSSTLGFYLHRLPCEHPEGPRMSEDHDDRNDR